MAARVSRVRVISSKLKDVMISEDVKSYPEFMLNKFTEFGDIKAMVDSATGKYITYTQLVDLSRQCASALVKQGLRPGDTLAIVLPNMIEYPVIMYGTLLAGGTVTTMNSLYTSREIRYQLRDSGAEYVVTVPGSEKKVRQAAAQSTKVRRIFILGDTPGYESFWRLILKEDAPASALRHHVTVDWKNDTALLLYSSGTTGVPKGVMLTHYNLISHHLILNEFFKETGQGIPGRLARHVGLLILPMFHVGGASLLLGGEAYQGYTFVCMSSFQPEKFFEAIEKYKVTQLCIVPPLAVVLAKHPDVARYDFSHVKEFLCGAAPLGENVIRELKKRLPNAYHLGQAYGLTEASPLVVFMPIGMFKPASVGMVPPNIQVKVVDITTGEALPSRHEGEICVKGPNVMKGYLNNPEATMATIDSDGWLHTGDLGYYDDEEMFYIAGRLKELIKYKGYQVAPAELEDLLLSHPDIADAAVIGVPDHDAGELPKAFIVQKEAGPRGITAEDVSKFVAENAVHYKKLRGGVEFVEAIPKNASGKIMRRKLKEKELEKRKSSTKSRL